MSMMMLMMLKMHARRPSEQMLLVTLPHTENLLSNFPVAERKSVAFTFDFGPQSALIHHYNRLEFFFLFLYSFLLSKKKKTHTHRIFKSYREQSRVFNFSFHLFFRFVRYKSCVNDRRRSIGRLRQIGHSLHSGNGNVFVWIRAARYAQRSIEQFANIQWTIAK